MSKWILIDNIIPGQPVAINLDTVTDITWDKGTLTFELFDSKIIETECEMSVFIDIVSKLDIIKEIE